MKGVYLDYAATTPVDSRVRKAMETYFTEEFGNPGSLHQFGQRTSAAVFKARQTIAAALNCHYADIVFTGSATEANNLAIAGALNAWYSIQWTNRMFQKPFQTEQPKIIISEIEHESIYRVADALLSSGRAEVAYIPVSKNGIIDLKKLAQAIDERTVLVSVMYANNETGAIQPIREISALVREFREAHPKSPEAGKNWWPLFHTDASQAFQYYSCAVDDLGVDLLTLSSQKIYGPKGIGALYLPDTERIARAGVTNDDIFPVDPIIFGGGQESNKRSGTENVPAIVGFGKAVELVEAVREKESKRIAELRDYAWKEIKKIFPKAQLNGPDFAKASPGNPTQPLRLHNNLNFYVSGVSGEQLLVGLDLQGIAISSGSACTARSIDPSHVLLAMGYDKIRAKNSLRITLGRMTTKHEIDYFVKALFLLS